MSRAILCKLNSIAPLGTFCIVDTDDLFDLDPTDYKGLEQVKKSVSALQRDGFIEVKFSHGETFCVALLKPLPPKEEPKAAALAEPKAEPVKPLPTPKKANSVFAKLTPYLPTLAAFVGGFLGALVAGFLCTLFTGHP